MTDELLPTADIPHPSEMPVAASWWIWVCWLERGAGAGFVYGCAARNFRPAGWTDDSVVEIPDVGRLVVCQRTVTDDVWAGFRTALDAGKVILDPLIGRTSVQAHVAAARTVIQEGLGQTAVRTALYYTMPKVSDLLGDADGALEGVLSFLQEQLNLPFKGDYASHLGNFDIFDLNSWLDAPQPFLIEFVRNPGKERIGPQTMEICRTPVFSEAQHTAHLVGRINEDVVVDRLISLAPGEHRVPVQLPEMLDEFNFRIFSADGETLLHSEHSRFMNRVGFVLAPVDRQITIEDNLSGRAAQKGGAVASQASIVVAHSSHRSMIGGPAQGSWRKFAEDMEDMVDARLPKPSEDKWFPRGIEGEVGAIAHLNHLLSGGQISRAVLVDPWFGADALRKFVLRLGSRNIHLTIVTSWVNIDPDTQIPLDPARSPTEKLEAALRQIEPYLNPSLTVVNLLDAGQRAFHDRYLLLYPYEGPAKIFLLSNSINNLAGNWPFSMSLLGADVTREVKRYIEGLCSGRDIANNRQLNVSFEWPPHVA
jgi:hypothetical protein